MEFVEQRNLIIIGPKEDQLIYGYDGVLHPILVDSIHIGNIGLFYNNKKFFSDIEIFPEFRRKGYAKEAYKLLFRLYNDLNIYACVKYDNIASNKLHESIGFKFISKDFDKNLYVYKNI